MKLVRGFWSVRARIDVSAASPGRNRTGEVPSPIFVAALFGIAQLRVLPLSDETFAAGEDARDQMVKAVIVEHYRAHAGWVPAFGAITGYLLVVMPGYDSVDFGLPFDVNGDAAGPMREVRRFPDATLGTRKGDKRLTGLLKNTAVEVYGGTA